MSLLFSPVKIGRVEVNNRFVRSATNEGMATPIGEVTDRMIKVYQHGGKIVFQLSHSGRQTKKEVIGRIPMAPSSIHRDLINFQKPVEMSEKDIHLLIRAFALATQRASEVGADGVQLHAGHGYLFSQFLSPFFNQRSDEWGGSDENRFLFFKETTKQMTIHAKTSRTPYNKSIKGYSKKLQGVDWRIKYTRIIERIFSTFLAGVLVVMNRVKTTAVENNKVYAIVLISA